MGEGEEQFAAPAGSRLVGAGLSQKLAEEYTSEMGRRQAVSENSGSLLGVDARGDSSGGDETKRARTTGWAFMY